MRVLLPSTEHCRPGIKGEQTRIGLEGLRPFMAAEQSWSGAVPQAQGSAST